MTIFNALTLVLGLCLFLFGMNLMGDSLEKKAGGKLQTVLTKVSDKPAKGLLLGAGVTAVIQSSSATTVTVVGFVNSKIMSLRQAIYIIMGANIGTTVTAWILSLSGLSGDNFFVKMLKPASFTPLLALAGMIILMFVKKSKLKDTGMILLSFAILMTGMDIMTGAVSQLRNVPEFAGAFLVFTNPLFGVLAGTLITAIIQSSSASVGILQSLASTGAVSFGSAIPIIMGQNIGTCVTALISGIGANKNAKRAAMVHLYFNVLGTVVLLGLFYGLNALVDFSFIDTQTDAAGIAVVHTAFNLLCTAILLPFGRLLEKLACLTIKDGKSERERGSLLDERLLATPSIAVQRCEEVTKQMAGISCDAMRAALTLLETYSGETAERVCEYENEADVYEDELGSYLVKVSSRSLNERDSNDVAKLLHIIGDFERISDHARDIVESAEEIKDKSIEFSEEAKGELSVICGAIYEILGLAQRAFDENNSDIADRVEPLEQVVDGLKEQIRHRHINRLRSNICSIEHGFVLSDILTDLERVSDHCSNIAGCVIEMSRYNALDMHNYLGKVRRDSESFDELFDEYEKKYRLASASATADN